MIFQVQLSHMISEFMSIVYYSTVLYSTSQAGEWLFYILAKNTDSYSRRLSSLPVSVFDGLFLQF